MQIVIIITEEDGIFSVNVPDYPDCTNIMGYTEKEAVDKAYSMLPSYLETLRKNGGRILRVPRSRKELDEEGVIENTANVRTVTAVNTPDPAP